MSLQINFTSMDDITRKVNKMIRNNDLTVLDVRKIRERLLYCCGTKMDQNFQLEFMLGNLDLEELRLLQSQNINLNKFSYLESAKNHFRKVLSIHEEQAEAIYNLFKIAVIEEDYESASLKLNQYEINEERPDLNLSLVYKLLNCFLVEKKASLVADRESLKEIEYQSIYSNYSLAEKAFDEGNYEKVVKHLNVCLHLSERKNFPFDFSPLLILSQKIFELDKEKQKKKLKNNYVREADMGNRMMIVWKLLDLDATDIESYFLLMDTYIDLKAYTPIESYLRKIKKLPTWLEYSQTISWYECLYREKMLEDKYIKEFDQIINYGLGLSEKGDYEGAIQIYQQGYNQYHYPYFQLKIAEVYDQLEDYKSSVFYAEAYLHEGNFAWQEASFLLYKGNRKMEKSSTAILSCIFYYQNSRMQKRGKTLDSWICYLNQKYLSEEESSQGVKTYNRKKEN